MNMNKLKLGPLLDNTKSNMIMMLS